MSELFHFCAPHPRAICQQCLTPGLRLVSAESCIDRDSGQRITITFCEPCARRLVATFPKARARRKAA